MDCLIKFVTVMNVLFRIKDQIALLNLKAPQI